MVWKGPGDACFVRVLWEGGREGGRDENGLRWKGGREGGREEGLERTVLLLPVQHHDGVVQRRVATGVVSDIHVLYSLGEEVTDHALVLTEGGEDEKGHVYLLGFNL